MDQPSDGALELVAGMGEDSQDDVGEPIVGDSTGAPGSASACPDKDLAVHGRQVKYPRVDPPEVEEQPGQAIREDTPGYIPKSFRISFPHGAGDYHDARHGLRQAGIQWIRPRRFELREWLVKSRPAVERPDSFAHGRENKRYA